MIVEDAPYDLVVVFADADAKMLIEQLIEKAQVAGLIRPIRWRSMRDARRDAFRSDPVSTVSPFRSEPNCKFVFLWDHQGSGREMVAANISEREVIQRLVQAGFQKTDCLAVAFDPELECLLVPVWDRVKQIVASIRQRLPPSDETIYADARRKAKHDRVVFAESFNEALRTNPKELMEALIHELALRWSPSIFQQIGREVSLSRVLTGPDAARIFHSLSQWFP